jgi:hypothetical protein
VSDRKIEEGLFPRMVDPNARFVCQPVPSGPLSPTPAQSVAWVRSTHPRYEDLKALTTVEQQDVDEEKKRLRAMSNIIFPRPEGGVDTIESEDPLIIRTDYPVVGILSPGGCSFIPVPIPQTPGVPMTTPVYDVLSQVSHPRSADASADARIDAFCQEFASAAPLQLTEQIRVLEERLETLKADLAVSQRSAAVEPMARALVEAGLGDDAVRAALAVQFGGGFKQTSGRPPATDAALLDVLRPEPQTLGSICTAGGWDSIAVGRSLKRLVTAGVVARVGERRATKYYLPEEDVPGMDGEEMMPPGGMPGDTHGEQLDLLT